MSTNPIHRLARQRQCVHPWLVHRLPRWGCALACLWGQQASLQGWGRGWAGWALWPFLVLGTAWAQTQTDTGIDSGELRLSGLIKQGSCQLPLRTASNPNPYVLNLPPLQTVQLMNNGFGKITPLNLNLIAASGCLTVSGLNAQIAFDGGLAAVVPNGGLLRNVAILRPALSTAPTCSTTIDPSNLILSNIKPTELPSVVGTSTTAGEKTFNLSVTCPPNALAIASNLIPTFQFTRELRVGSFSISRTALATDDLGFGFRVLAPDGNAVRHNAPITSAVYGFNTPTQSQSISKTFKVQYAKTLATITPGAAATSITILIGFQ